jgi:hypothetical protein
MDVDTSLAVALLPVTIEWAKIREVFLKGPQVVATIRGRSRLSLKHPPSQSPRRWPSASTEPDRLSAPFTGEASRTRCCRFCELVFGPRRGPRPAT